MSNKNHFVTVVDRGVKFRRHILVVLMTGSVSIATSMLVGCQHTGRIGCGTAGDAIARQTCGNSSCNGCQTCRHGFAGSGALGGNSCSGAACEKPTLAQVVQNAVQPCPAYPAGCMPPDIGAATSNFFGVMGYQAEADDFVFYDFEWIEGTAEPADDFAFHLNRVVPRLAVEPFPIVIETTGDSDLDAQRYRKMVQLAMAVLQARIESGEPTVPIRHLGPTNKVVHLPQVGANYAGTITPASHGLDANGTNYPSKPTEVPVIGPEQLARLASNLESRIVIGRSAAYGQYSDTFGRRFGFSRGTGQGGQAGGQGGGQGGGFGGGGGGS